MVYLDPPVNLETMAPEELLDLLDQGAPPESQAPQGRKETWDSPVLWVPLEAEGHRESSELRVPLVSQDPQAPPALLAPPHQS